jgi:hypothetical protein
VKLPWGDLILVGGIGLIAYFMKDTLLSLVGKTGGTSDLPVCDAGMIQRGDPCRVASPFPYLPNTSVMPEGTVWVSGLCMYFGIGCPEGYGAAGVAPVADTWPAAWTMSSEDYWQGAAASGYTLEEACRIRAPTQMQFDLCMASGW